MERINCENAHCQDSCCPCSEHFGKPLTPESAPSLDDEISRKERLYGQREERVGQRKREREKRGDATQLERYIKAISGPAVCGALVTVPTILIMFCKVTRRKKMRKLWSEGRNEKTVGDTNFNSEVVRMGCRR